MDNNSVAMKINQEFEMKEASNSIFRSLLALNHLCYDQLMADL